MEERSPKLSVKVRNLYNGEHGKLRAVLSVPIGGAYAIHGLKLYETEKGGLFLSMPSQSYEADGETKYTQIFHPITARGREYLEKAAHLAYHMALESQKLYRFSEGLCSYYDTEARGFGYIDTEGNRVIEPGIPGGMFHDGYINAGRF